MKQFTPEEGDRIEFYRDGDEDLISYKLEECTYDFKCTNGKWELYKQNYSVTLDNADNAMEFHYVVNNEQRTLAAGSKQKHSSKYPLVFRFDDGQGETRQKRVISGKYRVAVTADGVARHVRASDVSAPLAAADLAARNMPSNARATGGETSPAPPRPLAAASPRNDAPRLFD